MVTASGAPSTRISSGSSTASSSSSRERPAAPTRSIQASPTWRSKVRGIAHIIPVAVEC
jgi:hypothetical protein